jgi:LEA14-like dessication related protein
MHDKGRGEADMSRVVSVVLRIVATACLIFVLGCAGVGKKLEAPRVSLADVRIQEMKGLENVFHVDLRVFNTNDIPLTLRGVDCDLTMNGKRLATGVSKVEQEIPAYGTTVVPMILYSSVVDLFRGVIGLHDKEKVKFGLTGNLRVEGGIWMPSSIPFNAQSEFSLDALQNPK